MLPPDGASGGLKGFVMDERVAGGADVQAASEGPESLDNAFEEMQARMAQFEQVSRSRLSVLEGSQQNSHRKRANVADDVWPQVHRSRCYCRPAPNRRCKCSRLAAADHERVEAVPDRHVWSRVSRCIP